MGEHMPDPMKFEVLTVAPERLEHSPSRRFRRWAAEVKARIVAETFAPGASVSAVARSYDLDPSQLFAWRRKALSCGKIAPLTAPAASTNKPVKFTRFEAMGSATVDIIIGDAVVRAGSDVDPEHLDRVLQAVRKA